MFGWGRGWMKERSCFKWDLSSQFSWNHLLRNLKLNAQGQKGKKTTIKVTGWLSSLFSIHLWSEHKRWDICSRSSGINYMLIVILQLIIHFMTTAVTKSIVSTFVWLYWWELYMGKTCFQKSWYWSLHFILPHTSIYSTWCLLTELRRLCSD